MKFDGYYQKTITVVEFSETGNAAYLYDDSKFLINLNKNVYRKDSELKVMEEAVHRIHHRGDWETRSARDISATFGIKP